MRNFRFVVTVMCALSASGLLAGCAQETYRDPLERNTTINQSRHVSAVFEDRPLVLEDTYGFETARLFFPRSETLVLCDETTEAQLRAASIAVFANAPMLVYDHAKHSEYVSIIAEMQTDTVLTVGDVAVAPSSGAVRIRRDPGGLKALGEMASVRFTEQAVADPGDAVTAVANLSQQTPTWLRATWADPIALPGAAAQPFPIQSRRDANMAPQVVATRQSSIPSVANARAYGAGVVVVSLPDPRRSEASLFAMAGLSNRPLVALGQQFGTGEELAFRIRAAERQYAERIR